MRDFDFGDGSRVALSQLHASRADLAPQAQFAVHPARHEPAVGEVFGAGHPLPVTVRVAVKGSCFFSGCELHLVEGVIGGPHDEVRAPRVHGPDAYGLVGERDAHAGGVDGAVVPPAGYRRVHEFARGVGRAVSQECAQVGSAFLACPTDWSSSPRSEMPMARTPSSIRAMYASLALCDVAAECFGLREERRGGEEGEGAQ